MAEVLFLVEVPGTVSRHLCQAGGPSGLIYRTYYIALSGNKIPLLMYIQSQSRRKRAPISPRPQYTEMNTESRQLNSETKQVTDLSKILTVIDLSSIACIWNIMK
jgi:hypothetical protein